MLLIAHKHFAPNLHLHRTALTFYALRKHYATCADMFARRVNILRAVQNVTFFVETLLTPYYGCVLLLFQFNFKISGILGGVLGAYMCWAV